MNYLFLEIRGDRNGRRMEDLMDLHLSCKEEKEQAQEFACHLGWSGLEWERERRRIMGTGRSINQQIFIEQLPWLAAGASSAGGRHIRKLSIKRWLWGRGRDVFFWNRIEQARLLCCLAREVGTNSHHSLCHERLLGL